MSRTPPARRAANGLAAAVIALGIIASVTPSRAQTATAQCPLDPPRAHLRGVNRVNLAWVKDYVPVLDSMRAAGVRHVRFTLVQPSPASVATMEAAAQRGFSILLNVPLGMAPFYPAGARVRSGQGRFNDMRGLSELDVDAYARVLAPILDQLAAKGVRLDGLEIGNEINWADFNGDLPLTTPGRVFDDEASLDRAGLAGVIAEGFRRYAAVLEATRRMRARGVAYRDVPIVSAGLYGSTEDWVRRSGGSAIGHELTLRLFAAASVLRQLDGFGVHLYPSGDPSDAGGFDALLAQLGRMTAPCGTSADGLRPACWITEWGYALPGDGCAADDSARLARLRAFDRAVGCLGQQRRIAATYLYDWDLSRSYSVYRCNRVLNAGRFFAPP